MHYLLNFKTFNLLILILLNANGDADFLNRDGTIVIKRGKFLLNTADSRNDQGEIPDEFNSAKAWPECRPIIEHIDDQLFTPTCIYFLMTHVLADRLCIETKGRIMVTLSAWDLISCCPESEQISQCLWEKGVTTGGSFWHADSGCRPFEAERCSREQIESVYNNFSSKCIQDSRSVEICMLACASRLSAACSAECIQKQGTPLKFFVDGSSSKLNYGVPIISGIDIEKAMMREIIKNGPIIATMSHTLNNYTGGIIQEIQNTFKERKHGVRIIGWSTENGTRYWIAANSYGQGFGENGWIRIQMGRNLMGIEYSVLAPRPDLKRLPSSIKNDSWRMNLTFVKRSKPVFDHSSMSSLNTLINWLF